MPEIGYAALVVALAMAAYGASVAARGARSADPGWLASARNAALAQFLLVTAAGLTLEYLLVTSDFSVRYVAQTSISTSPLRYKIAGLWGALEGSILLWEWLQALFVVLVARKASSLRRDLTGYALAVLFVVSGIFLLLLVAISNPFARLQPPPAEGRGLNPLLEVTDMLVHPLLLYTGYVGFVVPYAFGLAALLAGRLDGTWLTLTRRWTVTAWLFLTAGILYGGWWSYRTLGWGGYWAWDPVENASFMPWLMGTAFVHSVMVQERRPMLKIWNVTLITLTFALTIFGTFLTRSGVLSSVHAFASGGVGPFLLGYLAVILLGSLGLLAWRWERLGERAELDGLLSRESVFLLNNLLLAAFCFTVFFGTIFPLLSEAVTGAKVSVGTPYFNWVTMPISLVILLMMGAGPLVPWRRGSWAHLARLLRVPAVLALAGSLAVWLAGGVRGDLVAFGYTLPFFAAAAVLFEFVRAARGRSRVTGENPLRAFGTLCRQNHRRYGGLIVHLGVVLVAIGIATSSIGKVEREATLHRGETLDLSSYRLRFTSLSAVERSTHLLVSADVEVFQGSRLVATLQPGQRLYPTSQSPFATVDIRFGPMRDLYVILGAFDREGRWVTLKAQVHPMIAWIWIGGLVVVAGGLVALGRERRRLPAAITATEGAVLIGAADTRGTV
ncbi:MAG TPA: heme lyase CcmF/NrfE family subunit [Methylomirabilota bacterium]|jgi:cytochrome c-type biogenesis protein CcmF|nr:heme lyase CcmF/NrfE family subunit [Methylomirabilota bacterium]